MPFANWATGAAEAWRQLRASLLSGPSPPRPAPPPPPAPGRIWPGAPARAARREPRIEGKASSGYARWLSFPHKLPLPARPGGGHQFDGLLTVNRGTSGTGGARSTIVLIIPTENDDFARECSPNTPGRGVAPTLEQATGIIRTNICIYIWFVLVLSP